jgi:hypothetical protein
VPRVEVVDLLVGEVVRVEQQRLELAGVQRPGLGEVAAQRLVERLLPGVDDVPQVPERDELPDGERSRRSTSSCISSRSAVRSRCRNADTPTSTLISAGENG